MIIRNQGFYNQYMLDVSGWRREVFEIHVYDKDGVMFTTNSGYFEDDDGEVIDEIWLNTDKDIKLKRKLKFDGDVFVMTKDKYREKYWSLYIPNKLLNFESQGRILLEFYSSFSVSEKYVSDKIDASYLQNLPGIKLNGKLNKIFYEFNSLKEKIDIAKKSEVQTLLNKLDLLKKLAKKHEKERERILSLDLESLEIEDSE